LPARIIAGRPIPSFAPLDDVFIRGRGVGISADNHKIRFFFESQGEVFLIGNPFLKKFHILFHARSGIVYVDAGGLIVYSHRKTDTLFHIYGPGIKSHGFA
jgi:hypothetical protein